MVLRDRQLHKNTRQSGWYEKAAGCLVYRAVGLDAPLQHDQHDHDLQTGTEAFSPAEGWGGGVNEGPCALLADRPDVCSAPLCGSAERVDVHRVLQLLPTSRGSYCRHIDHVLILSLVRLCCWSAKWLCRSPVLSEPSILSHCFRRVRDFFTHCFVSCFPSYMIRLPRCCHDWLCSPFRDERCRTVQCARWPARCEHVTNPSLYDRFVALWFWVLNVHYVWTLVSMQVTWAVKTPPSPPTTIKCLLQSPWLTQLALPSGHTP